MPRAKASAMRQRNKLAAVPILLIVLLKVLTGDSNNEEPSASEVAAPRAATGDATRQPSRPRRERQWPAITVEEAIRHNPFTYSGRRDAAPTSGDPSIAAAAEPIEAAVTAYFQSTKGEVALIDGQVVRVGDIVDGDWRVVKLSPDSAVLAPADAAASGR